MRVILSIKPKYVKEIVKGNKKYELRKAIFKKNVSKVYVYESSPTMKIVGTFKVGKILKNEPSVLWKALSPFLGIDKKAYSEYFKNAKTAYAIEITEFKPTRPRKPAFTLHNFMPHNFKAPQSFSYCSLIL